MKVTENTPIILRHWICPKKTAELYVHRATDNFLDQLGKYPSIFQELGIWVFNWVTSILIPNNFLTIEYFLKKLCYMYTNNSTAGVPTVL